MFLNVYEARCEREEALQVHGERVPTARALGRQSAKCLRHLSHRAVQTGHLLNLPNCSCSCRQPAQKRRARAALACSFQGARRGIECETGTHNDCRPKKVLLSDLVLLHLLRNRNFLLLQFFLGNLTTGITAGDTRHTTG